jgi:uncharacterized protein DUF4019
MRSLIVFMAVAMAGCSMSADTKLAEQAVPQFHAMLDAGRFDAIYEAASEDLRKATKQDSFVALLEAIHRKLGTTKSSAERNWNVNYQTSGTFVTLDYSTTYAEGDATEQFVYRLKDGKALLAGYHINSTALILK